MIDIKEIVDNFLQTQQKDIIYLCESGSKTYGFATEKSDLDLRGIYLDSIDNLFAVHRGRYSIEGFSEDRKVDWQVFEIQKFLSLLCKGNFNILEWIFTPYVYKNECNWLKPIGTLSFSKQMGNHVRGWTYSMYKMDWDEPKKCLYAIRPLMVYINLIETKQFISDINLLKERFDCVSLVDRLKEKNEKGLNTGDDLKAETNLLYQFLVEETHKTEKDSWLPEHPNSLNACNALLRRVRIRQVKRF